MVPRKASIQDTLPSIGRHRRSRRPGPGQVAPEKPSTPRKSGPRSTGRLRRSPPGRRRRGRREHDERRVEEVHPGAAEDLLAEDEPDDGTRGRPAREGWSEAAVSGMQRARDEEALRSPRVPGSDAVTQLDPQMPDAIVDHGVDRQEVERAEDARSSEQAGRVGTRSPGALEQPSSASCTSGSAPAWIASEGLVARVPHRPWPKQGSERDHDGDHHPLVVEAVADVGARAGHLEAGAVEANVSPASHRRIAQLLEACRPSRSSGLELVHHDRAGPSRLSLPSR